MTMTLHLKSIHEELPELYAHCLFVVYGNAFTGYMSESKENKEDNVIVVDGGDVPVPLGSYSDLHYIEMTYLRK